MDRPEPPRGPDAGRTIGSEAGARSGVRSGARSPVEVELVAVPGLGGLYARGIGASARLAVAARLGHAAHALPDVVYLAHDVRADADHLTAYQHLLGESASDVLPAGFVHVLAFPVATALMVRPDFPLPLAGMVHLANRVEQLRPVSLGDALEVRAYARDLRAHRVGTTVELVTEVRVVGGVGPGVGGGNGSGGGSNGGGPAGGGPAGTGPAWRGVSTYLAKGTHLATAAPPAPDGSGAAPGGGPGSRSGAATRHGPGARPDPWVAPEATGRWRLDGDVGRKYASVSGDRNPIHLSALTARALGFPRAIAHGMYTASRALAVVGAARTDAFTWTVEFAAPVLLPGTVTLRIAAEEGPPGFGFAGWDARAGRPHFTGTVVPGGGESGSAAGSAR